MTVARPAAVHHGGLADDPQVAGERDQFGRGGIVVLVVRITESMSSTLAHRSVRSVIDLPIRGPQPMPQDVKLSPDGHVFYVADMHSGGVWKINARSFAISSTRASLPTGAARTASTPARDADRLTHVAVARTAPRRRRESLRAVDVVQAWTISGGSPDMGGVSADGKVLWLSGQQRHRRVHNLHADGNYCDDLVLWQRSHGLCVWPQPEGDIRWIDGRYYRLCRRSSVDHLLHQLRT